jgi:hypothetical protein
LAISTTTTKFHLASVLLAVKLPPKPVVRDVLWRKVRTWV